MFLTAIKVKVAAMVAVAGLDTVDMPGNQKMEDILSKLAADQAAAQKAAQDKTTGPDINKSFNDALAKVQELAAKENDKDAQYALAHWGVLSNSNISQVVDLYRKAAAQGQTLAKVELAQVLLQAAPNDINSVKEAVALIQEAEGKDNKLARRLLANLYLSGAPAVGIEQSVAKAQALLEKGSQSGDGEATLGLSQLYAAGVPGLPKDEKKSLELLVLAAEKQNNPVAMSTYAARLFDGDTATADKPALVKKDPAAAMKMFEAAASQGFAAANRLLGAIYERGLGGNAVNLKTAVDYYTKAANGNDGQALFRLGNFFETGLPPGEESKDKVIVQQNPKSALDLYRMAAQNGQAEAFFNVGVYYETGTVVDKDLTKAFNFLLRAAVSGVPQAQFRVANLYQQGGGTNQDPVAAIAWFERSAAAGLPQAQLALGQIYENATNYSGASAQYQSAAAQGMPLAMLRLASLAERGLDQAKSTPNKPRAMAYAELAVEASNKDAIAVQYLEALKKGMTAEQVAEGTKLLESLKKPASAAAPATAPSTDAPKSKGASKKGGN